MKQAIDYIETDKQVTREMLGDQNMKIFTAGFMTYPHGCHAWLTFPMSNRERKMNWIISNRYPEEYWDNHIFHHPVNTWLSVPTNDH